MSALAGSRASAGYAAALWPRLKTQHVWLLPFYVKRFDPFTRFRRTSCLVSAIGIHVLWMAMLLLVSHSSLELTLTMPRRALACLLVTACCITTIPITKSVCTLYEASVMMVLDVPPPRQPPIRLRPRSPAGCVLRHRVLAYEYLGMLAESMSIVRATSGIHQQCG